MKTPRLLRKQFPTSISGSSEPSISRAAVRRPQVSTTSSQSLPLYLPTKEVVKN